MELQGLSQRGLASGPCAGELIATAASAAAGKGRRHWTAYPNAEDFQACRAPGWRAAARKAETIPGFEGRREYHDLSEQSYPECPYRYVQTTIWPYGLDLFMPTTSGASSASGQPIWCSAAGQNTFSATLETSVPSALHAVSLAAHGF